MVRDVTRSEEPRSRLERLVGAMSEALERHPEYRPDDRAIIMLDSVSEKRGGLVTVGYDSDELADAAAALLGQVEALFKANGLHFTFVPVDRPPGRG